MAARSQTYALLVGIERYDASSAWSLDGPASDVRRLVDWLLRNEVPQERIRVLLSTLDRNVAVRDAIKALLGVEPGGTRAEDVRRELIALGGISADLLLFYWGGHGWATPQGEYCLFCTDATLQKFEHLDLASLLESMRTDWYPGLKKQVFLVDACATFAPQRGSRPPRYDFGGGKPLPAIEQFALFAAKPGESSTNLDAFKTGLFSSKLFEELGLPAKHDPWPPAFPAIGARLRQHFEDLKNAGQASQTPSQFWYRDSATGDESFFGMSPLTALQGLLTEAVAGDERTMMLARAWYVRSLRHVPTATDRDRDAGERSIAEMLSALDDWRQQPPGDLPLLTFAEGLAEKALREAVRQQVKRLTARRAREKGLDDAEIDTARARLRQELAKAPDALQVFLEPERSDLPADDPQMTFKVALYLWLGASETDTGGGRTPYGQCQQQTLPQAQAYVNRRLMADLADAPPACIEFFVPYRLMCCEVDQWPYRMDDTMSFAPPLSTEFPVVIRSYDRTLRPALRESSKKRWPFDPAGTAPARVNVAVRWLEDLQQSEQQVYNALRPGGRAPCLVLGALANPDASQVWRASVWAGVSIGLWLRSGAQSPSNVRARLCRLLMGQPLGQPGEQPAGAAPQTASPACPVCGLLTGQPLGQSGEQPAGAASQTAPPACPVDLLLETLRDLPQRVYQARQHDPHLGPCLTLCWDDPHRLPPVGWQVSPGTDQAG